MTVPPQPQGYDFSPGTIWNQDMLNTSAANRAADLKKYSNYTGFQDNDPSFADILTDNPEQIYGPKNRMGDYAPEIPINQPTDVNGQPISLDFQGGGDAQALADAERYNQIMSTIEPDPNLDYTRWPELNHFGQDWTNNDAFSEYATKYKGLLEAGTPQTYSTSGYGGRSGDQYAEQPGERAAYMQAQVAEQARLAQEEQLFRDEKESNIGLANYTPPVHPDVAQANQNIFEGARLRQEKGPDVGLADYTPPINEEQRKRDENLFNLARMEMEKGPDIGKANYVAPINKKQREADQKQYNAAKIARGETLDDADVSMENLEQAQADEVEVTDGEHWWTTPDSELNRIIEESGLANWLDSAEENTPDWAKDFIKGMKENWDKKEYATLAGKIFVTRLGVKWGLSTAWKMLPFTSKGLTKNMVKVVIAGETHQIYTELDSEIPILEQIQAKVDEIMAATKSAVDGPEIIEVDGDGNVIVVDDKDKDEVVDKDDGKPPITSINALRNDASLFSQYNGSGGTTTAANENAFNGGVTQQQGYTGNIGDMFSNLWNPNPEQRDYWYKTREGDVPGNNRMREAMARLAYMGLYPEDRGDDPYRQLSDDRIAYNNNQLDAASSQATLNATASNRQYTQWKNMLPTQAELARQLVETKGWAPWGMSQDELDKKAEKDAGSLLRKFHGLMAKGVAPTPENLLVATKLEKAGIPVNAQTVQYALENGLLDEKPPTDDSGGKTKTSSMISNAKGFLSSVQNAFQ
jgi:hypothetical protein